MAGGALFGHGAGLPSPTKGVPGSDRAVVKGIRLIDPEKQGIRYIVHSLQRRFGIPDRHCVDVDALRTMTTQQLLDRHMAPDDVEKEAERYDCNKAPPLGHPRMG